jgi:hypothetical protein
LQPFTLIRHEHRALQHLLSYSDLVEIISAEEAEYRISSKE